MSLQVSILSNICLTGRYCILIGLSYVTPREVVLCCRLIQQLLGQVDSQHLGSLCSRLSNMTVKLTVESSQAPGQLLQLAALDYDKVHAFQGCIIAFPKEACVSEACNDPQHFLSSMLMFLRDRTQASMHGSIQIGCQLLEINEQGACDSSKCTSAELPLIERAYYGDCVPDKGNELVVKISNMTPETRLKLYKHGRNKVVTVQLSEDARDRPSAASATKRCDSRQSG